MTTEDGRIRSLYRRRPRDRFARASIWLLLGLAVGAWFLGDFDVRDLFSSQRAQNLERFLGEARPVPLRDRPFDWDVFWTWVSQVLETKGWRAAGTTLAISVAAIVLAGLASLLLCAPAARTLAAPDPYLPAGRSPGRLPVAAWRALVALTRSLFILLRALPEYVWAFLLLAIFGPTAWPAVLALAIHNTGILGKLYADTLENLETPALRSLRGLGARRRQIVLFGAFPAVLGRFLLYFFYRWETCVREATVLGMLGIVSLGYFIMFDARPRFHYGEMILLILLGSAIVLVGDLVSAAARAIVRRAS